MTDLHTSGLHGAGEPGPSAPRGHGHGHGHGHAVSAQADRRYLTGALALIVVFMAAEVVVGVIARSLALISDAGHMLTDAFAIVFALAAMRIAARPPRGGFTYGLKRAEIVSAQLNGITLLLLAAYFVYEGVHRLIAPPQVAGGYMLATGLAGIAVNLAATWLLRRADRSSLNVEGAFQHILNDLYAFIATTAAGAVIMATGWARADAVAALVVAALMLKAGWGLVRDAGRVFMEAAPWASAPPRSAAGPPPCPTSSRSTTCTCGRSPPATRRCRRTSWSPREPTATPYGRPSSTSCTTATASGTPPCRSITPRPSRPPTTPARSTARTRTAPPTDPRTRRLPAGRRRDGHPPVRCSVASPTDDSVPAHVIGVRIS